MALSTTSSSSPAPPSSTRQFLTFVRSAAGLERTLRLLQALSQIVWELSASPVRFEGWGIAKSQLALTRRFFRFFNFVDYFDRALVLLSGSAGAADDDTAGILPLIELGQWTCFGLYHFLEDLTMLHAMGIYTASWGVPVLSEANKFWFYALSLSLLGSLYKHLFATRGHETPDRNDVADQRKMQKEVSVRKPKAVKSTPSSLALKKRLIVDACDLLIPGVFLGWIPVGGATVGMATVVSTVITAQDIWLKIQSQ